MDNIVGRVENDGVLYGADGLAYTAGGRVDTSNGNIYGGLGILDGAGRNLAIVQNTTVNHTNTV